MSEHQESLQQLVRHAAEGWAEHTASDEEVLRNLQYDMILYCMTFLWNKGHGAAGASLLTLVPKAYAEKMIGEITS